MNRALMQEKAQCQVSDPRRAKRASTCRHQLTRGIKPKQSEEASTGGGDWCGVSEPMGLTRSQSPSRVRKVYTGEQPGMGIQNLRGMRRATAQGRW